MRNDDAAAFDRSKRPRQDEPASRPTLELVVETERGEVAARAEEAFAELVAAEPEQRLVASHDLARRAERPSLQALAVRVAERSKSAPAPAMPPAPASTVTIAPTAVGVPAAPDDARPSVVGRLATIAIVVGSVVLFGESAYRLGQIRAARLSVQPSEPVAKDAPAKTAAASASPVATPAMATPVAAASRAVSRALETRVDRVERGAALAPSASAAVDPVAPGPSSVPEAAAPPLDLRAAMARAVGAPSASPVATSPVALTDPPAPTSTADGDLQHVAGAPSHGHTEFDVAMATATLARGAAAAAACGSAASGWHTVTITFAPSGRVTNAVISGGPLRGMPAGACLLDAFRRSRVSPFEGPPVSVSKTVTIP